MAEIKWAKGSDRGMIHNIAERAYGILEAGHYGRARDVLDYQMDVEAVHCNGCPLDLKKLYEFDEIDFLHDILGIQKHLDRKTGKLGNFFLPRSAKSQ